MAANSYWTVEEITHFYKPETFIAIFLEIRHSILYIDKPISKEPTFHAQFVQDWFNAVLSSSSRYVSPFSQATKVLRESTGIALLCFQTSALEGGEGSASRPGRLVPPGKTRFPLYRRLGGPQVRSGKVRKISPPPGFNLCTVHPVASCYTGWATGPTNSSNLPYIIVCQQNLCV
jgi:hypothetical protein